MIKPINLEALTKWTGHFPEHVLKKAGQLAPMLNHFGYNPDSGLPNYGAPDALVQNNTNSIQTNSQVWQERAKMLLSIESGDLDLSFTDRKKKLYREHQNNRNVS